MYVILYYDCIALIAVGSGVSSQDHVFQTFLLTWGCFFFTILCPDSIHCEVDRVEYVITSDIPIINTVAFLNENKMQVVFKVRLIAPIDEFCMHWLPWATHRKVWDKMAVWTATHRWVAASKRPFCAYTFLCVAQGDQSKQNSSKSLLVCVSCVPW